MNVDRLRKQNDEVFYADEAIVRFGSEEIEFVKRQAAASPRRRARICAHLFATDRLHEMLIALKSDGFIRPHKHLARVESFQVFEGSADVVVFDDDGQVIDVVAMSDQGPAVRMYRLNASRYHTVIVRSPFFVVHETTLGPFDTADTVFAPWSPTGDDPIAAAAFTQGLEESVRTFLAGSPR